MIFHAALRRPRGFCYWLPKDAARHIKLAGELLHQVDCFTADFILPPNPLISLVYINILGILRWLNVIAGTPSGCSFEIHFRHFHRGISYVCLGDFNCSLPSIDRLVGTPNFRTSSGRRYGPQHGDMATFACLLQDFQLSALNCWEASHGATYRSPNGDSRIDFILTRHRDADNMAKQVGLLDATPFLPTGAHHIPMMTSLNYKYFRPPRNHRHSFSRQVKTTLLGCFEAGYIALAEM